MPNSLANPTTLSHSSMRATALALKLSVNFRLFFLIFRDTHSPFAARPTLARVSILGSTPSWPTRAERSSAAHSRLLRIRSKVTASVLRREAPTGGPRYRDVGRPGGRPYYCHPPPS